MISNNFHEPAFDISKRYNVQQFIGRGSFGEVWIANDIKTGENVAIKKVFNVFMNCDTARHTLRELRLLRHFNHENILSVKNLLIPFSETKENYNVVYIVTDLMATDLCKIINSKRKITDEHQKTFIYQIMRGLKFLHSSGVTHRDIKPPNILINTNCDLKIGDLGAARSLSHKGLGLSQLELVTSRWYRPPEGLMYESRYTSAVDVWSVGCIFAELLCRKPVFPGKHNRHQLDLIIDLLGTPHDDLINKIENQKCRDYLRSLPFKMKRQLVELFPQGTNPLAIDLLEKMLVFDPSQRITVSEALKHPYLAVLHDPMDEPTALELFNDLEGDEKSLDLETYRSLIYKEVEWFEKAHLDSLSKEGTKTFPLPTPVDIDSVA